MKPPVPYNKKYLKVKQFITIKNTAMRPSLYMCLGEYSIIVAVFRGGITTL
jgi:hypothetical protein